MRQSQKGNRARSKSPRKSNGPSINRVYESSGPEGKVRGTPQQIIEKYQSLARDKATAGDRILSESFLQHAEHYIRILTAAQAMQPQPRRDEREEEEADAEMEVAAAPAAARPESPADGMAVIEADESAPADIVQTPEAAAPAPQRRQSRRRASSSAGDTDNGAEDSPRKRPRRAPRKAAAEESEAAPPNSDAPSAAGLEVIDADEPRSDDEKWSEGVSAVGAA